MSPTDRTPERGGRDRAGALAPPGLRPAPGRRAPGPERRRRRLDRCLEAALRPAADRPGGDRAVLGRRTRRRPTTPSSRSTRAWPSARDCTRRLARASSSSRRSSRCRIAMLDVGCRIRNPGPRRAAPRRAFGGGLRHRLAGGGQPPAPTPSATASPTGSRSATGRCRPWPMSASPSSSPTSSPRVLVDLAPRLAAHVEPGGVLLAGGIIAARADEVVAALGAAGLDRDRPARRRRVGGAPPRGSGVTLHRFFVEPAEMAGDRFPLPAAIERQVRAVLRLRDGDRLVLLAQRRQRGHLPARGRRLRRRGAAAARRASRAIA